MMIDPTFIVGGRVLRHEYDQRDYAPHKQEPKPEKPKPEEPKPKSLGSMLGQIGNDDDFML
ncbi:MAG: hypothetical protein JSS75_07415 [Bacteroidetes bacterium]|nr:hypothetical protein [Bacteroidota bacterium]